MEEILKNIESEVNFIKEQQEELNILANNSKEVRDELKKLEEERDAISDKESGFYKDLSEKISKKDAEFRQEDIKRMTKDREINKLIAEKKELILKQLEEKKKYIDENRDADLQGKNIDNLKEEREKLQKEIRLNDTTKEEFEKMSDSEKQEVRKAKENYLNNKHRLDEITPTIGLMEVLDGKDPKDKFIEIEDLIKTVENKFNRDSLDEIVEVIGKDENQEENWYDPKGFEDALKEAQERKAQREEQEAIYAQMSKEEFAKAYNPNYKGQSQGQGQGQGQNQGQGQSQGQGQNSKYEIVLNISKNKINVNGNENLFYKEESKNKKELIEKYAINSYFSQYKKEKKSIDYALISTLENIDENNKIGLVDDYLSLIRGSAIGNKSIEEIKEEFNNAVEIEYKFADEPLLSNLKEKKIARNAKKLGIATLDGISEKSLSDKIRESFSKVISKMKSTKLLKGKEKQKALGSGEITNAEKQKVKDRVKVDNRDNRIEKNATLNNLVKADEKQQPETEQGRDVDD